MLKDTLTAISNVSRDLCERGIGKDSRNKEQGFNFRGIDQILHALSPLLVKHGLVILPNVVARVVTERVTKSGTKMQSVDLDVVFSIIHTGAEDPKESVTVRVHGEAQDSGDKATNKAMSAAYKYAAIQAFCIPVDAASVPDADAESPEESVSGGRAHENRDSERSVQAEDGEASDGGGTPELRLSAKQVAELNGLLAETGYPAKPICDYYKVEQIKDIAPENFKAIKANLNAMIKKHKASKPQAFQGIRE